ncbi:RNA polymerase sigma-70 factor, ECF family [Caenispirillum salinarum AK4]|uniref:RNA polymerase sigma-70 factor, ECF family n=1 Tax=Caenispirillum salinarum AK4 TaxID=1238182 RepID=K9H2Q1_9PROT|nr:sigma-70 family RNA polymerase sigma factor [Caenispirillum salinarum]EKV32530.1 RNA polymerase sigma-70 factor, ECF family [Caenispirillum salinarum AK4]
MSMAANQQIETLIPDLKRYARSLTRTEDDANDLVQDCVERAIRKWHLYKPGTNLRSWLFTMMRNVFISQKRREAVSMRYMQQAVHDENTAARPSQVHSVFLKETVAAMDGLSEQERAAVHMLGMEERSHHEAAEETHLPVGTMKSRLSRGRANLRTSMQMGEGDLS